MTKGVGPALLALALALPAAAAEAPGLIQRFAEARAAVDSGDFARAEALYRSALPELQRFPALYIRLAEVVARHGFEAEGLTWLERAAALGSGADPARLGAAFGTAQDAARWEAVRAEFARNQEPVATGSVAFTLRERDLIPESLAFDPVDGAFYVGSLRKRKIVRVGRDGEVADLVPSARDGLLAVLGMKVHPTRRELWANACSLAASPPMDPPDPASDGQAALFRFSLPDGALLGRYTVADPPRPLCFNDLAFTPDGSVYLSAGPNGVFRLAPGAREVTLAQPYDGLVNGIAASDDGRRLFLADAVRGVVRLDVAAGARSTLALPLDATLAGIDGLYVRGRTLVAVQNGLTGGPARVVQAWLGETLDEANCVTVLDRNHPAFDIPTTGVLVDDDFYYVASSQLRRFDDQGHIFPWDRLTESTILRTPLRAACPDEERPPADRARDEIRAAHRADRWAHFQRDVDLLLDGQAPEFVSASRGAVARASHTDTRALFERVFAGARYLEWDDLEPPVLRVAEDGTLGTALVRVRVRRVERAGTPQAAETSFVYAGTMTYERRGGRLRRALNASTFAEGR